MTSFLLTLATAAGTAGAPVDEADRIEGLWLQAVAWQQRGDLVAADRAARAALALLDAKPAATEVEFAAGQDDRDSPRKRRVQVEVREERRRDDPPPTSKAIDELRRRIEAAERELRAVGRTPPRAEPKPAAVIPIPQPPKVVGKPNPPRFTPPFAPPTPLKPFSPPTAFRPAPVREASQRPEPKRPENGERDGLRVQIKHLRAATEHLQQGGMPDVAREVGRRAEELERKLQSDARRDGAGPEFREAVERLQNEMREAVKRMQHEMREALEQTRMESRNLAESVRRQMEDMTRQLKMQSAARGEQRPKAETADLMKKLAYVQAQAEKERASARDVIRSLQSELARAKQSRAADAEKLEQEVRRLRAQLTEERAIRQQTEGEIALRKQEVDELNRRAEESLRPKKKKKAVAGDK